MATAPEARGRRREETGSTGAASSPCGGDGVGRARSLTDEDLDQPLAPQEQATAATPTSSPPIAQGIARRR